ncbi:hypothetical protein Nepgr_031619 [Nepenthes gracilis]|uniref:Uncharacterized protein n=1 Tax=Nepenthes gracilis TaxID=150966 RepID=A0AAD3Y7N7_NEPGR|nr:hypothetical protein Nepgr_031619 [Nepenthes gracilis]
MPAAINANLPLSLNPKALSATTFCYTASQIHRKFSSKSWNLLAKCNSEKAESGGLRNVVSNMVGERVEELLNREENKVLLDRLNMASDRVEKAMKELAEIERQENENKQLRNFIEHMEGKAAEIAECQKEVSEARVMLEEAEHTLSMNTYTIGVQDAFIENETSETDRDKERWESVKAAAISASIGLLAGIPISAARVTSSSELLLPVGITVASCALFGIMFRYTVRRDLDNVQLKTGISAAFGIVKGLSTLNGGAPLEMNMASLSSHALDGLLFVSEASKRSVIIGLHCTAG